MRWARIKNGLSEVLLEIRTETGSDAESYGAGLGIGVTVGEGGMVQDAVEPPGIVVAVAGGVFGGGCGGSEVARERASQMTSLQPSSHDQTMA